MRRGHSHCIQQNIIAEISGASKNANRAVQYWLTSMLYCNVLRTLHHVMKQKYCTAKKGECWSQTITLTFGYPQLQSFMFSKSELNDRQWKKIVAIYVYTKVLKYSWILPLQASVARMNLSGKLLCVQSSRLGGNRVSKYQWTAMPSMYFAASSSDMTCNEIKWATWIY